MIDQYVFKCIIVQHSESSDLQGWRSLLFEWSKSETCLLFSRQVFENLNAAPVIMCVRACESDRVRARLSFTYCTAHGGDWGPLCSRRAKSYQDCCTLHHMAANPCAFTQSIHTKHPIMSGSHMCYAMLCLPGETGQRMGRDLVREMPQIACHVWAQREAKLPWEGQGSWCWLTSRVSMMVTAKTLLAPNIGHTHRSRWWTLSPLLGDLICSPWIKMEVSMCVNH